MAAATKSAPIDATAAIEALKKAVALNKGGDPVAALKVARDAEEKFPLFRFPDGKGGTADFAALVDTLAAQVPAEAAPAKTPAKPPAKKAAPAKAAAPVQKAQTVTLRMVHDGIHPTSIFGVQPRMAAVKILGKRGGLGWDFARDGSNAWTLRRTAGYAPDMNRIEEAAAALLAATSADGTQLYRLESDIRTTGADGRPLPERESAEALAQWQREHTAANNLSSFQLGMGQGVCVTCDRAGLTVVDGRITKDARKIPQVQCATCTGEVVEDLGLGTLLALPSAPSRRPEARECPACRQLVEVVDGKLRMHSKPIIGGSCRGRLPMADVEPDAPVRPRLRVLPAGPEEPPASSVRAETGEGPLEEAVRDAVALVGMTEGDAVAASELVREAQEALTAAMGSGVGLVAAATMLENASAVQRSAEAVHAQARETLAAAEAAVAAYVAPEPDPEPVPVGFRLSLVGAAPETTERGGVSLESAQAAVVAAQEALTAAIGEGTGIAEAAGRLQARIDEQTALTVEWAAVQAAAEVAASAPAPTSPAAARVEAGSPVAVGATWRFKLLAGTSGMRLKDSAQEFRSDLGRALPKGSGVKVEVRRDKQTGSLVATLMEAPEDLDGAALAKVVLSLGKSQRGVVSGARVAS